MPTIILSCCVIFFCVNTDLIIGFSQPIYNFDEPDDFITTNIYLVKEGNKSTEQTFEVQISLIPSVGIAPATHFEDFVLDFNFSKIISFRYNQNAIPLVLVLNPDDKSEQNEEILLESSPVSFPFYSNVPLTSNVSRATRVIIMDDDRKFGCKINSSLFIIVYVCSACVEQPSS